MHRLGLSVLFLAVCAGTTAVLHRLLPGNEQPLLRAKLDALETLPAADFPDLIFLGSSRTYHGFIPSLFDEVLAQRGHPLRSFNLGVTGLKLSGNVDVLRRLEALVPEGAPRWLLIDPESPETLRDLQHRSIQGVVNWYDSRTVQLELSWILKSDMPVDSKWTAAQSILHAFAFRAALVGRATPLLDPLLERGLPAEEITFRLGPLGDGFRSKDGANKPRPHQRHRQFLRRREHYLEQLDKFRRASRYEGPALEPLTPEGLAMFERIVDTARALGAEPVFVTQPAFNLHGELRAAAGAQAHRDSDLPQRSRRVS